MVIPRSFSQDIYIYISNKTSFAYSYQNVLIIVSFVLGRTDTSELRKVKYVGVL